MELHAPLAALQSSARGWHGIQLAVLGFIGLCGVLQGDAGKDNPAWVRDLAAILVLGSLVLACAAVAIVGTVAWPVDPTRSGNEDARLDHGARRLRRGIALTFVAVAALAAGTTSSWWPDQEAPSSAVEVNTGRASCAASFWTRRRDRSVFASVAVPSCCPSAKSRRCDRSAVAPDKQHQQSTPGCPASVNISGRSSLLSCPADRCSQTWDGDSLGGSVGCAPS